MSKRGKLPGYESDVSEGFAGVAAHGTPFDSRLMLHHSEGELGFELRLNPLMPRVFLILLIVTIWPGLPLTEGFLDSFTWYADLVARSGVKTWYWYLPLTVLPAPFAWKSAIAKSRASAFESAKETIGKIGEAIL